MRLWIINHYALIPSKDAQYGRHYAFANYLAKHGWDITLLVASTSHPSGSQKLRGLRLFRTEWDGPLKIVWLRVPSYRNNGVFRVLGMVIFSVQVLIYGLLSRREASPTVVLGSTVHLLAAWAAWVVSVSKRAKFIFEFRDIWPETLVSLGKLKADSLLARAMKGLSLQLAESADHVISPLSGGGVYLRENLIATPFTWLPNGVARAEMDTSKFVAPPPGPFVFMYLGSMGNIYDFDSLIRAAEVLAAEGSSDFLLQFVGDGTERQRIFQMVREKGLESKVVFRAPVPRDSVSSVLQEASCLLLPSKPLDVFRFGISPNKFFDYLLVGRPIIAGRVDPTSPVESAGAGLEIDFANPTELLSALRRTMESEPEIFERTRGNAHKELAEKYVYELNAEKLRQILQINSQ